MVAELSYIDMHVFSKSEKKNQNTFLLTHIPFCSVPSLNLSKKKKKELCVLERNEKYQ
jgi:hypothetical protein